MNSSNSFQENPHPFGPKDRKGFLVSLQQRSTPFDLCVIGGGITGAAIARDASLRGLSVLLVEKHDFAWGTSSRSSKLVHGGVRYLENLEFKLVFESTKERALLWQNAPDLCKPIPFLFPSFKESRLSLFSLSIGLWLYDALSLFRSPGLHRRYSKDKCRTQEPALKQKDLRGAIFYWDGATDDALLTLANIIDAHQQGAVTLSKTEVTSIDWASAQENSNNQAAHKIHFKDILSGETISASARCVIGAAGPWTDELHTRLGIFNQHKRMAPTRGSHIVLPKKVLPVEHAIVMTHPSDGRVLFAIPWDNHTVIGTTDIFDSSSPDDVSMTPDECEYLIRSCAHFFPEYPFQARDIVSTWTGLRPLLAPPSDATASDVSREHEIKWDERGYLYITGGKLTTHREMAKEAVDTVVNRSLEWNQPLSERATHCSTGDRKFPKLVQVHKTRHFEFSHSELGKEQISMAKEIIASQMVLSLEDFLVRRTEIFYKHPDNGLALMPVLKPIFCEALGWTDSQWLDQVGKYETYLEHNIRRPLSR